MNKSDLIQKISSKTGAPKAETERFFDALVDVMKETLVAGDNIKFNDVCIVETVSRAAREGRNPQTGEPVSIPASKALKIKTLTGMKKTLNG